MRTPTRTLLLATALALASAVATPPATAATPTPARTATQPPATQDTVTLSGVAYSFTTGDRIPRARITVPETGQSTTASDDGSWAIEVPAGGDATVRVSKLGFHTMYTQTFQDLTADVDDVYLQTPDLVTATALRALVTAYEGRDPFSDGCVVVSTVSDPRVVGMPFDEFVDFAPHGVAGSTAQASPSLGAPYYFNDDVIPVPHLTRTSTDGGVLFANVPEGTYQISASHPEVDFASATATCEGNRLINASPPQGLHGIPETP